MSDSVVFSIEIEYRRYKVLAEDAMAQLTTEELRSSSCENANTIATVVWHLSGSLRSRFTDFLSSDGEKPWRQRDREFLSRQVTRSELTEKWDEGWRVLFGALAELGDGDLSRTVTIRGVPLTVLQALHRSLAHASYHVGQIICLAKSARDLAWRYLSIPPGQSETYHLTPALERAINHASTEAAEGRG